MIKSMTGYGKGHFSDEKLNLDIEIKTVNSRYFDANIRMPYQLNFMEDKIRTLLKKYLNRGRIDVFIRSKKKNLANSNIDVDLNQAKIMYQSMLDISESTGVDPTTIRVGDILRNDDVLTFVAEDLDDDYVTDTVLNQIDKVLQELVSMRKEEGKNLYTDLLSNIELLRDHKTKIQDKSLFIKNEIRNKLEKSIKEAMDSSIIDEDRLATEIIYYADKHDINEELTRLDSHFDQFTSILDSKVPSGKKLDFITQEILRETNTIGSKSSKIDITNLVIEMKTIIEKIKEQVQNVE